MQNKGFVKFLALALTLVCIFYLSFSVVTGYYTKKAADYSKGDPALEAAYLDSLSHQKIWLGNYTLKDCREMEIGLGLDLKGGMDVILEVSVGDVVKTLAGNNPNPAFNRAVAQAAKESGSGQSDFITLFVRDYHALAPGAKLAELFATQQMKDKVTQSSSDAEVEKVLRTEVKAAIDNSRNVLSARIDRFGVVQPNIQNLQDKMGRIMVELPGVKDPRRVERLLQGSANLEFWETYDSKEIAPYLSNVDASIKQILGGGKASADTAATAAADNATAKDSLTSILTKGKSKVAKQAATAEEKAARKEHPLLSILQPNQSGAGCIVGYASAKDTATVNKYFAMPAIRSQLPSELRLKWGVKAAEGDKTGTVFELYAIKASQRDGKAPLGGNVITDAKDEFNENGQQVVGMTMNSEGSRLWAQLTKDNVGHCIAIVLDGYVYSAPTVNGEITGGRSSISGHFTPEEAKDLANVLKSGKMPAPAHIVQEDVIGPSLGQDSINSSIISFVFAIIVLMTYMCLLYGFIPGMVANGALLLNLFFTLGVLASFQAALTLSGIAGMVLTLGIAVDANVLIYERTREELRLGMNVRDALAAGYKHAFSAIFDSNLTALITGIILFFFGTGPILGFATTYVIGLVISFFTAVFLTHLVFEHFMSKDKWLGLNFTPPLLGHMCENAHYDIIGNRRKGYIITAVLIIACFISFGVRGMSMGIDFTGGRNYVVQFDKSVSPEHVRDLISNHFGKDASVSVISIGTKGNQVRISTNYRIDENTPTIEQDIETKLYESVKPLLGNGVSLKSFITRDSKAGGSIVSSTKVGASVASDTTRRAIIAVLLSMVGIGLYILLRFKNISYSVGSVVALALDACIVFGAFSAFWGVLPFSLEMDQTFMAAILTVIGYSMNDKVVIFDRVREYFHLYKDEDRKHLFNDSLNSTLSRTINTTACTLIVLVFIFLLGAETIRSFSFAMILGVVFGTLSSLFVSSPIAFNIQEWQARRKEAKGK